MFLSARSVCTIWGKAALNPPAPAVAATGTVCVVGEHMWAYGPNTQHLDSKHVNQCHRRWRKWLLLGAKSVLKYMKVQQRTVLLLLHYFKKTQLLKMTHSVIKASIQVIAVSYAAIRRISCFLTAHMLNSTWISSFPAPSKQQSHSILTDLFLFTRLFLHFHI